MTKDVLIHISGLQFVAGEQVDDAVETITSGEYYYRSGSHFLLFEEMMEGFSEPVHNYVKFRQGRLEMRKKGLIQVQMIFEEGKKNLALYQTPYGQFEMGISTTHIRMSESEKQMDIHAEYALEVNGSYVADCRIHITVRAKNPSA